MMSSFQSTRDAADAVEFIESIFYGIGEFVEIAGTLRVSSDVDDDMFVETAITARAQVLVAENRDLHEPAVRRLLHQNGVAVLYPKQFRKLLAKRRVGAPPSPEDPP
jgi:predicted nucleic acid-binding protein